MASYTYELIELGDDVHGLGCKCCRFSKGLDLPSPRKDLSTAEARKLAVGFATSVLRDWTALNAILKRFEETVAQKGCQAAQRDTPQGVPGDAEVSSPGLPRLPGDLEDRAPIPHVPIARLPLAVHQPRGSAATASLAVVLQLSWSSLAGAVHICRYRGGASWAWLGVPPQVLSESRVNGVPQRTPRKYGEVLELGESLMRSPSQYSFAMIFVSRTHPSLGLFGLEVQAGIYSFLLDCAKLILHDVHPAQYFLAPHQAAPAPLMPKRGEWITLQDHMLEAPYRLPQGLDLDRIKAMVSARRSAVVDHLWMLREDPGYFIENLNDWKEHDYRDHKCTCGECWRDAAAEMISDGFSSFLFWHAINRLFKQMPSIEAQLARADLEQVRLKPEDEQRWAELDGTVNMMMLMPMNRIRAGLPSSPRLRHCYPNAGQVRATVEERWIFKFGRTDAERRVDIVFNAITNAEQRSLHQLTPLIQEAQYMLDTQPASAQLVDGWILNQFSDLALLAELGESMDRFKPWVEAWRVCSLRSSAVDKKVTKLLCLDSTLIESITIACKNSTMLYPPSSRLWQYPANKRPSKANTDQMRHAEAHLDLFWEEIEEIVLEICGEDLPELLAARGLRRRKLHRTPAWKEPVAAAVPEVKMKSVSPLTALDTNVPRFGEKAENYAESTPKCKIKTRGAPTLSPMAEILATPEPTTVTPGPSVKVKKRTYRVFDALLPHPGAENHQRTEIAWDDLLQAMNDIGMLPEKLYGSVWSFKPTPDAIVGVTRGIQFHEPREVWRGQKINAHMVRVFGRRLQHAYGWTAGIFVCE
ncbi:cell agglutination protein Mam3 [Friedmanniomyces endolithicus]|nr:cell agglutination protein Mam3 [Friedmanniomyces endolithicus]KAK0770006.1 cell agglutination protein Mam3 [Friedmanniomyces endolithicus]KAK0776392.1 cell agglutination protein Mam3 [Friedmanniomyces endolithicus]KAK0836515.1 cell agglutination protein Mam3 [Friedmanniomyces endolithicus]KAK0914625.1 cell agglutination protein Mam3 [Friedmanniomyces endolithicus]